MDFDKRLGEGQAEAGPFILAVESAIDLLEGSQRFGNVLKRNPDAGIDDLEYVAAFGARPSPERDLTAGRGEFDRVGQQIDQDLLELGEFDRVGQQIDQDLLELAFIGAQRWDIVR